MLSLSPRADLFRFYIPKEYIPEEVLKRYDLILSKDANIITSAIDYLNESIQGISFPGITELTNEQSQVSTNTIIRSSQPVKSNIESSISSSQNLGRINREPNHTNITYSSENPLEKIDRNCIITFRKNQGLYNYFMIYETILHRYVKPELYEKNYEQFSLDILNESGLISARVLFSQPKFSSLDGLEFSYSKTERDEDTFTASFAFNNIDIDFDITSSKPLSD